MNPFRIALANLRFPATPEESVTLAEHAIQQASEAGAQIVCFPECFIPGLRGVGKSVAPPDPEFLEHARFRVSAAAAKANITVVVGTERVVDGVLLATALVVDQDGSIAGFQDKVQIDPSEDGIYTSGAGRRVFQAGPLTFGVAICHEGWRYPETVRWAARHGAQLVFHPHYSAADPDSYRPASFADPANSFHEKAALCRAAENTCYFATINFASPGSPTTSAVVRPDGTLLSYQPYGQEGLLIADIDISSATGLLAARCKPENISPIRIVPATEKDLPIILELIRALADYEKLADKVIATEEQLRQTLFGSEPAAEVVLAYDESECAGFAVFFATYSTFLAQAGIYLEDLYVKPHLRGQGIGLALLQHLARLAIARGCGRLEWAVLNWNEPAIGFYRKLGAVPMDEWTKYQLSGEALRRLSLSGVL